jgi:hypothetical protein
MTMDLEGLDGFCRQAAEAWNAIVGLTASSTDPRDASAVYASAYDVLAAVEPPEALAEDWATVTELVRASSEVLAEVDVTDQQAMTQAFADAGIAEMGQAAVPSRDRIDAYLADECGTAVVG